MLAMNAITTPTLSRPRVLEPGAGSRRWLTLLLSVEGIAALAATITFVALAPDANTFLGGLGTTAGVALLLLGGVSAVIAVMAFSAAAAVMRRRDGAVSAAAGVQLTVVIAALTAGLVGGFDQSIVAGAMVAVIGLLLTAAAARATRSAGRFGS